jgi:hypothetical protein
MGYLIAISVSIGILLIKSFDVLVDGIAKKCWLDIIFGSFIMIVAIFVETVTISDINNIPPEPTALDVYRGLTELEITSDNGVPQDTVVVFKK